MNDEALREALERLRGNAEAERRKNLLTYQEQLTRFPDIAAAAKTFADRNCGQLDAYAGVLKLLAASEPTAGSADSECTGSQDCKHECPSATVSDALKAALKAHISLKSDLVGWFGRCSCQKQDEMPIDFETVDEWVDHVFEQAALLRQPVERSPSVTEARKILGYQFEYSNGTNSDDVFQAIDALIAAVRNERQPESAEIIPRVLTPTRTSQLVRQPQVSAAPRSPDCGQSQIEREGEAGRQPVRLTSPSPQELAERLDYLERWIHDNIQDFPPIVERLKPGAGAEK